MMAYAKCTLGVPNRGGKGKNEAARMVKARIERFERGEWMQVFAEEGLRVQPLRSAKKARTNEPIPPTQRVLDKGFMNSMQGFLDDGAFSKAAKHLLSNGVHDAADPEVRRILEGLHPKAAPVGSLPGGSNFSWSDESEEVRKRLKKTAGNHPPVPVGECGGTVWAEAAALAGHPAE